MTPDETARHNLLHRRVALGIAFMMPLLVTAALVLVLVASTVAQLVDPADYFALKNLYDSTGGENWQLEVRWNAPVTSGIPWDFNGESNPCLDSWYGVSCSYDPFMQAYRVSVLDLESVGMQGTLPSSLRLLSGLTFLRLAHNRVYGQLPHLESFPLLEHLDISYTGRLTGRLPSTLDDKLQYLLAARNDLTGPIPDFSPSAALRYLDLSANQLTGTIPQTLDLPGMTELFLTDNLLHGELPEFLTVTNLSYFDISHNFLSGTLPSFIAQQIDLLWLNVEDNLLAGPVDGLVDVNKQGRLTYVNIAQNPITGLVPGWIFNFDSLSSYWTVAAGYNCFHGTLPAMSCNSTTYNTTDLGDIRMDLSCLACHAHCTSKISPYESYFIVQHPVHGTLPTCLFEVGQLVISHNYFTGTLPADAPMTQSFIWYDLSYNQLTGTVPASFVDALKLGDYANSGVYMMDFSNNKLTGGFTRGERLIAQMLDMSNNRMSGPSVEENYIKGILHRTFDFLEGNLFSCAADRSDLHEQDTAYERYDCGSDSVEKPLYALLAGACTLAIAVVVVLNVSKESKVAPDPSTLSSLQQMHLWANAVLGDDPRLDQELPELRRVMKVMRQLTVVAVVCALVAVVLLAPMFAVLTAYYGTHDHEYAWTVASVLLAGRVPFALCFAAFVCITGWAAGKLAWDNAHAARYVTEHPSRFRKGRIVIACSLYVIVNFAVVGGANAAYVAIEIYATPAYQIALSVFKVGWNIAAAPYLSRYLAYELSAARADWVALELFVSGMSNIGIPLLAVVVISPRCLFGVVGSQISLLYSEADYQAVMDQGRPFHYSYQCSFQYVNSYVAAFEYMCLMTSFVTPLSSLLIEYRLRHIQPGQCGYGFLSALLLATLRPLAMDVASVPKFSKLDSFFDCTQFFVMQYTYLTMICTVGLVFPPLAATAAVAMVIAHAFAVLSLGRVLTNARAAGVGAQYAQLIEDDCARVANPVTMRHAVWLLLCFCGVFYPIFLFDTLGDAVGVYESYWVLISVPALAFTAVMLEWVLSGEAKKQERRAADYEVEVELPVRNEPQPDREEEGAPIDEPAAPPPLPDAEAAGDHASCDAEGGQVGEGSRDARAGAGGYEDGNLMEDIPE